MLLALPVNPRSGRQRWSRVDFSILEFNIKIQYYTAKLPEFVFYSSHFASCVCLTLTAIPNLRHHQIPSSILVWHTVLYLQYILEVTAMDLLVLGRTFLSNDYILWHM